MSLDTDTILEIFQYYGSEELKKLQTKLTKTANGLIRNTVESRVAPLFTDEERETLEDAARILRGFRKKVEHAKEVKARQERQKKARRQHLDKAGLTLAQQHFNVAPDNYREMLLIFLAVERLMMNHSAEDIAYHLENDRYPNAFENFVRDCYREALNEIGYQSHHYDRDEPDEKLIVQAKARFEESREKLKQQHQGLLDKVSEFLTIKASGNVTQLPKR
ncbi:MAG: hypothetical protein ABFS45_16260 [Pseudomonadota bacterium]